MAMSFTVVFRDGTASACVWVRAYPCPTKEEAEIVKKAVELRGQKALVQPTRYWDTIGLPEGWEP